jgi:hypothetical protein
LQVVAALRSKKNCEVWRKMGLFGSDSEPAKLLPEIKNK